MDFKQDFFISHASADKQAFVQPLAESLSRHGVTFWLDSAEIAWGDNLAIRINEGLRESRHVVLCLSQSYISRRWPEAELGAALARGSQGDSGKVLPLVLKDKDQVLKQYPILAGLLYKEFDTADNVAESLREVAGKAEVPLGHIRISIESTHTGKLSNLIVSPRASVGWLTTQARLGAGLKDKLETGGFQAFPIRWVLVDTRAAEAWKKLTQKRQSQVKALIHTDNGPHFVESDSAKLGESGVTDGTIFHLYAIEDGERGYAGGGGRSFVTYTTR